MLGVAVASIASFSWGAVAEAKAPGKTYCFVGKCHRVKTLSETESLVGKTIPLVASHYSDCSKDRYNPCGLTSSGEKFHPDRPDNAASPIYPDGTVLLVRNPATKASAVLRINNAGPYWGNRKLDVSFAAAERLGFKGRGVAKLETKILSAPNKEEAGYVRLRNYQPTPGFIGKFDSLEDAERTAVALMLLDATAASALVPSSSAATLVATRTESREERAKRIEAREKLDPIIKTMRLIADLRPVNVRPSLAAASAIEASPSGHSRRSVAPVRMAQAATGVENAARSEDAVLSAPSVETEAPRRRLAQVALAEVSSEIGFLEERATRGAVKLIRTAEVGAASKDDWEDLLRPRLGTLSLVGGTGGFGSVGGVPLLPAPGRAPRPALPYAPNTARHGMST